MKNLKLLGLSSIMALSMMGCVGSKADTVKDLQKALDSFGNNYSVSFVVNGEEDGYNPKTSYGDDFYSQTLYAQVTGAAKVSADKGTYHSFDHYLPTNIQDAGEYFYLSGRVDYTDADLKAASSLSTYFDVSKFERVSPLHYKSTDEKMITGYLGAINTVFGYYMFGYGEGGIEIVLTQDKKVDCIKWYGYDGVETSSSFEDTLYATAVYSDIGTVSDSILANYIADANNIPEPTKADLTGFGRDGHNLYEGEEHHFSGLALSSIVGEEPTSLGFTDENGYFIAFETHETDKFGDPYSNYLWTFDFDATLASENGHTILTNIKNVERCDELDWSPAVYIEDAETYAMELANWKYGVTNNGLALNILSLTFEGGTVNEEQGNQSVLNFSYTYCGVKYEVPLYFTAGASGDIRTTWTDFALDEGVVPGSTIDLYNVMFAMENGAPRLYVTETFWAEKGTSFNDLCSLYFGYEVPSYDGFMGYESAFYTTVSDGVDNYNCVMGIVDVYDAKASSMFNDLKALLEADGFEYQGYADDFHYFYNDGLQVSFTNALNDDGDYYYAVIRVVDIDNPIFDEPDVDWYQWWSGLFAITDADGNEVEVEVCYSTADVNGVEYDCECSETQVVILYPNDVNFVINYDAESDSYNGAIWTDGEPAYFQSVDRLSGPYIPGGDDEENYGEFWKGNYTVSYNGESYSLFIDDDNTGVFNGSDIETHYTQYQAGWDDADGSWVINYEPETETYSGEYWSNDELQFSFEVTRRD